MKSDSLVQNDMPNTVTWSTSKPEVEFQYGGRLYFQIGNSYILAVDWIMTTKFGLLIDTDLLHLTQSEIVSKIAPQQPQSLKSI